MKYLSLPHTDILASQVVMGCMRLSQLSAQDAGTLIRGAMEQGVNFFDHADIYGGGESERRFAEAVNLSAIRDKIFLQSKCGIRDGYFDFSKEHIIASCEKSLQRLGTDYLDVYLLHRPDLLMEPDEVAEAFETLHRDGKVRYFGVSNHTPTEMTLLQRAMGERKLIANQIQLSITHCPIFDHSIASNMDIPQSIDRTGGLYEYARLHGVTLQAWSPFQKGFFNGPFLTDRENFGKLNDEIDALAAKYGVAREAIAVAWLARIPAGVQIVMGSTKAERYAAACPGTEIELTRKEWYTLFAAGGKIIP